MPDRYHFGPFELCPAERRLLRDGRAVELGSRAFDLLACLLERRERLVTKDELLQCVWPGLVVEEANLTVQVSTLRKALGTGAIATVAGRGYQFGLPVTLRPVAPANAASASPAAPSDFTIDLTLPDKPSIAMLPFANLSADPAQEHFCDGVTDDVIADLSRFRGLLSSPATRPSSTRAGPSTCAQSAMSSVCATCSKAASGARAIASACSRS